MAEDFVRLTIHLGMSGGRPTASKEIVEQATFQAVNYAISDIAFKAARKQQRNIQGQLETTFGGIVAKELQDMGRKIASMAIGISSSSTGRIGGGQEGPPGSLSLGSPLSPYLKAISPSAGQDMKLSTVTGPWRARTQEYLRWKSKKFGHSKWWLNTGDLRNELKNPGMWLAAYGPFRLTWTPERIETGYAKGGALRFSTLARGQGRTYTVSTGQIHMTVLGRITRQMLNEPGERAYDSRFNGLLGPLPESVEKKLANRGDPYRPVIEPFLTYYLNRRIPNQIFLALTDKIGKQQSIKPLGVSR